MASGKWDGVETVFFYEKSEKNKQISSLEGSWCLCSSIAIIEDLATLSKAIKHGWNFDCNKNVPDIETIESGSEGNCHTMITWRLSDYLFSFHDFQLFLWKLFAATRL